MVKLAPTVCFNPRARVGRDRDVKALVAHDDSFQSTRPRGARHRKDAGMVADPPVSIHAPAWGATNIISQLGKIRHVSIHAPAWGATV